MANVVFVTPALLVAEHEDEAGWMFKILRADRQYYVDVTIPRTVLKEPWHGRDQALEIAHGGAVWHFWDMLFREVGKQ